MKDSYRIILYILIMLLILAGILLFFFRVSLLGFLQEKANLSALEISPVTVATSSDALDLSVLRSARFTGLVNNVISFDFDNVCHWPTTAQTVVVAPKTVQVETVTETVETGTGAETGAETATTTVTATPRGCVQGNSFPFFIQEN